MPSKSNRQRYGFVAVALHRTLSLLIFLQLLGGLVALRQSGDDKISILRLHAPLGLLIGLLAIARIVWWSVYDQRPDDIAGMPRYQALAAHFVHGLLYLLPIAAALTGYILLSRSGAWGVVFAQSADHVIPDFKASSGFLAHWIAVMSVASFVAIHICATCYHQFIKRDNILVRLRSNEPTPPTAK
jgi:cytochrome b561